MHSVYITNFCGHDYSKAEVFGQLKVLTSGRIDKKVKIQDLVKRQIDKIKQAQPDDFILLSGSHIVTVLIVTYWLKYHKVARLLAFNQTKNEYEEVTITDTNELWEEPQGQSN